MILRVDAQRNWGVADGNYPLAVPSWDSLDFSVLEPEGDPELLSESSEVLPVNMLSSSLESEWDFLFSLVDAEPLNFPEMLAFCRRAMSSLQDNLERYIVLSLSSNSMTVCF